MNAALKRGVCQTRGARQPSRHRLMGIQMMTFQNNEDSSQTDSADMSESGGVGNTISSMRGTEGDPYRPSFVVSYVVRPHRRSVHRKSADRQLKSSELHSVDPSLLTSGAVVKHGKYGNGQIRSVDHGVVVVDFGGVEKKFLFPAAFEQRFLILKTETERE